MRDLMVKKSSGEIQPFDREKLSRSIRVACRKRNVSEKQIESIVTSIHRRLETEAPEDIITSEFIGQLASESLIVLDPIAFVRFVSVYKKFTRVADFKKIIAQIPEAEPGAAICELPKNPKTGSLF